MKKFDIYGELQQMNELYYRRHKELNVPDYPRDTTGEYPVKYPPLEVFFSSKKEKLFSAFRIGNILYPECGRLRIAEQEDCPIHIDAFRLPDDVEGYFRKILDFCCAHRERTILCATGEIDSGHPWPRDYFFRDRNEAYEFFHANVMKSLGHFKGNAIFERLMKEYGLSWEDVNLMVHGCSTFAVHYYFEWGFPHVEIECGISGQMQVSLGYIRGAWKQFGRKSKWGIDYSTHEPLFNQCTWYDESGRRIGGFTESQTVRCWLAVWFAGADYLLCEGSDYTHWVYRQDGSHVLSELGKQAKKFAEFTLESGIERGEPVIPVAIMLNHNHGFEFSRGPCSADDSVWGGRVPLTNRERNIRNQFDIFYPGYRAYPVYWERPDFPLKTQQQYREALRNGFDMRPYEQQLTASTCGDCVDVLLDNASLDALHEYKLLLLGGDPAPASEILADYVRGGGTLAAAYNQLPSGLLETFGIKQLPGLAGDWDHDEIHMADGTLSDTNLHYGFAKFEIENAKILAVNHHRVPIIYEFSFGRGKVILCAVPFSQNLAGDHMLQAWTNVICREVSAHFPVKWAESGLEVMVNRTGSGYLLGLFNNRAELWNGTIQMKDIENGKYEEVYPGKKQLESLNATIEPFEVKIIIITLEGK